MRLTVIVPTLDEEYGIVPVLTAARRGLGADDELLVADGGSSDATVDLAHGLADRVVGGAQGRGAQMNRAAEVAKGDILLFLHADTLLPDGFRDQVVDALERCEADWGRFDLRFDRGGPLLRLIARLISWRSWLFASATGDQAIFVRAPVFAELGGFAEPVLFEDVELVRRLKRRSRPAIPPRPCVTSSRRWRNRGAWRTSFLMWGLKAAYLAGVPAATLARRYRDER